VARSLSPAQVRAIQVAGRAKCKAKYSLAHRPTCETCYRAIATDRHHLDGNAHNNAWDNVSLVCKPCHTALHKGERWHADRSRTARHAYAWTTPVQESSPVRGITIVQCRNTPGHWDGWNVYRGRRLIGAFAYKREAFRFAIQMLNNGANARYY
jgi:hypothetical protein